MSDDADLKNRTALVLDNGLFAELAPRLARDFGRVLYWMPWLSAYPRAAPAFVGSGLAPNVERVATFWDRAGQADVVVVPDLYHADAQEVLATRFHKPVWGFRWAENLELDRRGTRRLQKELGIPAPRTRYFTGVEELSGYLQAHEDKWVKISTFRGDGETFHHETWHTTRVYLDHFKNRVGALADSYEFLVEDPVEGVEVGYDGFTVRGTFPEAAYWGFEVKDEAYVGRFGPYEELPEPVRFLNEKLAPLLRDEDATGFCSFEFRLGRDGVPRMIDPCTRFGSPPFEVMLEAYDNLSEIVWRGAHGQMTPPKALGKYVALAEIHSNFALTNWVPLEVPPEVRRWVKVRNAAVIGGKLYHVPGVGSEMPEIGAVCGVADTLEEAIALVRERAARVKGYDIEVRTGALEKAREEIDKAREFGIEF